jgi:hypothetical protein
MASKIVKLPPKKKSADNIMMLRDFIHDRLYGSPGGYFTKD